jgi:hypothetical protein
MGVPATGFTKTGHLERFARLRRLLREIDDLAVAVLTDPPRIAEEAWATYRLERALSDVRGALSPANRDEEDGHDDHAGLDGSVHPGPAGTAPVADHNAGL